MLKLESHRDRWRVYLAAAIACYLAVFAVLELRSAGRENPMRLPDKNGIGGYAYLPSLVIDGDLEIQNQANIALGERAPSWMVSGRYPIGVALTLIPSFLAAHGVSTVLYALSGAPSLRADGFTIVYQLFNVAAIIAFWTTAMILLDRLLTRRFSFRGTSVGTSILLFWIGSYAFWYLVRAPFWAHVLSTAWLIVAVVIYDRVLRDLDRERVTYWFALWAFATIIAILCRLTNVFMAPFAAYLAYRLIKTGLWRRALRFAPWVLIAHVPVALQLLLWRTRNGGSAANFPEAIGYATREHFVWSDPVLLLPLFSSLQGLFFWSPLLLWSVYGLVWGATRKRALQDPIFCCWVLSALILWYINASWYAWWFGDAFGARAFLELGGLFVLGFAYAVEQIAVVRPLARRAVLSAVALSLVVGYGLMYVTATDLVDTSKNQFLFDWEREHFEHRRSR